MKIFLWYVVRVSLHDIRPEASKGRKHLPLPCYKPQGKGNQEGETGFSVSWKGDHRGRQDGDPGTKKKNHGEKDH